MMIKKDSDFIVSDILEISESIAISQNKSSGQIGELVIFSKANNRFIELGQPINEVLKNLNFDEFEIQNRYSESYSLQPINVRINVVDNKYTIQRSFQLSRFDKLSQIGEEILKYLNKTKEECELLFIIQGQEYYPFKINLRLVDINFIDNDEIQIEIPIKLIISLQDGGRDSKITLLSKSSNTFRHIENQIKQRLSFENDNVLLKFEVDNKILSEQMYNQTLKDFGINENSKISVKQLYTGGFQRQKHQY
ncbi:unnamed protein product [Paramecium pentaurelia]|uniref:Ubiquitin-like domain-containing protein n=1 Tax=Paramecium pentaurelia TaxID=43138 RepID=A0A8S1SJ48_9CILI|nr:unnamed protein product [Paramecium pentaurelia]CAD8138394.1 unnamed protein product [Paramecium pentaurelia]